MRRTDLFLTALAIVAIAFVGGTTPAGAQEPPPDCIWKCTCSGQSCGCVRTGAGGGAESCETGSNGCTVNFCDEVSFHMAPSGAVLGIPSVVASVDNAADAETPSAGAASLIGWEEVRPGHLILRNCAGLIIARYFDPPVARKQRLLGEALAL